MQPLRVLMLLVILIKGSESIVLNVVNGCNMSIWPATLGLAGSPQLYHTGSEVLPGRSTGLNTPLTGWSGRLWARTFCSTTSGKFRCSTGDCGSGELDCKGAGGSGPATLIEFNIAAKDNNAKTFYKISLVDGFNLPVSIKPEHRSGDQCKQVSCPINLNSACPPQLALRGSKGDLIGCRSACSVFNQPQYCCTGAYGSPTTCPPTSYSQYFKGKCPQASSYVYDDRSDTFECIELTNYEITFCP